MTAQTVCETEKLTLPVSRNRSLNSEPWSDVKWVILIVKCRNSFSRLWFVDISDKQDVKYPKARSRVCSGGVS